MMLRTVSTADYDKWITNDLKFDDPKVIAALEEFGWFAKNDDYVAGGTSTVATTDFRDSPKGLFTSPPQCYFHHQASFIPSFFPEGTKLGEDADFFYFPAYESKDLGKPVLGAGTTFAITKDSKGAKAFIEFLKSPIAHEIWIVDQADDDKTFNRGWLINVGFVLSNITCDYLVMHDVDLLPNNDKLPYGWPGDKGSPLSFFNANHPVKW